jgi:hypothetical protein
MADAPVSTSTKPRISRPNGNRFTVPVARAAVDEAGCALILTSPP